MNPSLHRVRIAALKHSCQWRKAQVLRNRFCSPQSIQLLRLPHVQAWKVISCAVRQTALRCQRALHKTSKLENGQIVCASIHQNIAIQCPSGRQKRSLRSMLKETTALETFRLQSNSHLPAIAAVPGENCPFSVRRWICYGILGLSRIPPYSACHLPHRFQNHQSSDGIAALS